jgi:hypothetical protein
MKYQLGISTRDIREARLFDEFKYVSQQESLSYYDFLAFLMRLYYQWKSEGQHPVPDSPPIKPPEVSDIHKAIERVAIALEKLVEKGAL